MPTALEEAVSRVMATSLLGVLLFAASVLLDPNPAQAQPFAYVTNSSSQNVTVINTSTSAVVGTVAVGITPSAVAVTPDTTRAYVTNSGSNDVSIIVHTGTSFSVLTTLNVGITPSSVAISPNGLHAYVVNYGSGTVSVI